MTAPVDVVRSVEKIGVLMKLIKGDKGHNGYPVVEDYDPKDPDNVCKYKKNITLYNQIRYTLILMLEKE